MTKGENIRKVRLERGLTQKALGELCGISEAQIGQYENNYRNPKLQTLKKIATALQVTISDLLDDGDWAEYTDDIIKKDFNQEDITNVFDEYIAKNGLTNFKEKLEAIDYYIVTPFGMNADGIFINTPDNELILIDKEVLLRFDEESDDFLRFKMENFIKTLPKDNE